MGRGLVKGRDLRSDRAFPPLPIVRAASMPVAGPGPAWPPARAAERACQPLTPARSGENRSRPPVATCFLPPESSGGYRAPRSNRRVNVHTPGSGDFRLWTGSPRFRARPDRRGVAQSASAPEWSRRRPQDLLPRRSRHENQLCDFAASSVSLCCVTTGPEIPPGGLPAASSRREPRPRWVPRVPFFEGCRSDSTCLRQERSAQPLAGRSSPSSGRLMLRAPPKE